MAVTFVVALMLGPLASADYQGLQVQLHTNVTAGGQARSVYRVYVTFDNPADRLVVISGALKYGGPMHIQSLDAGGSSPGGNFYNPGGDPNATFDTAPAIGVFTVLFDPENSIGDFIVGDEYFHTARGWAGTSSQGMAGDGVALPGGLWGVLGMQLTVNAGNHVRGTVVLGAIIDTPLAGATGLVVANQTFNSFPAPGGVVLLAIAGLLSPRRRRTDGAEIDARCQE